MNQRLPGKISTHIITRTFENVLDEDYMDCIFKPEMTQGVLGVDHYRAEFGVTSWTGVKKSL